MYLWFQITLFLIAAAFIVILIIQTIKHAKSLSDKIDEYHKEQDEKKNTPGPINPYADMGAIYDSNSEIDKKDLN